MEKYILLVSSTGALSSGASWSLIGLAEYLNNHGYRIMVLVPTHGDLEEKCKKMGLSCCYIRSYYASGWCKRIIERGTLKECIKDLIKNILNLVAKYRIARLMDTEHFDLVHINASTEHLAAEVAIKRNIKVVWHIREFLEEDLGWTFCNRSRAIDLFNKADRVIAISNSVRNKYLGEIKKMEVVYNGIDVDRFFCKRQILINDVRVICVVGRIHKNKGQDQVIEAISRLVIKGCKNVKLQIIGSVQDEMYCHILHQLVKTYNLENHVEFIEFTEKIETYYKTADIICVSSKKEAFGRVTIEGMVAGALLIGSRSGGTEELIEDEKTGYLYQEGNIDSLVQKMEYALNNPMKSNTLANNGQEWAKIEFSSKKNAENIAAIYDEII